jgi:hypothetical protein
MKLPSPPRLYDPLYEAQRNRILESFAKQTYVKGQDVGIYDPAKLIVPSVDSLEGAVVNKYGVFSDTTTQTASATYTPKAVTFNTTDASDGFSRGTPTSRIVAARKGHYNFQFSLQLTSGSSSNKKIWIWPRINGVDVPNSTSEISLSGSGTLMVPSWNWVLYLTPNDYYELMFAVDDTNIQIPAYAAQTGSNGTATFARPAVPSAILTVTEAKP